MNYKEYLQSPEWQAKRLDALRRAKHRCQVCNRGEDLNVHHRTYENLFDEAPEDLTVLCRACHNLFHEYMAVPPSPNYIDPIHEWTDENGQTREDLWGME